MIAYDRNVQPPALMIPVTLTGVVKTRPKATIQAMIDTGADITAVPASLKEKLRLYQFGRLQLEDIRGMKATVYTYEARLGIAEQGSPDMKIMEVILSPLPFVVLGRDWLQGYYLLLNGPEQQFLLSARPIIEIG